MRRAMKTASIGVAAVVFAAACSPSPSEPRTAQEPPACFQLTLGTWSGAHEAADPPTYLVLEDVVGTDGMENGQTLVRAVPTGATSAYPWMWWTAPPGDSLNLVFTGGYVGVEVKLLRGATTWKGSASAFSDVGGYQATAAAELSSMVCPP
jgi:hypothetical protein